MKVSEKMQRVCSFMLVLAMVFGMYSVPAATAWAEDAVQAVSPAEDVQAGDIVVLYDNDVHCAVDGYANLAALKDEMEEKTDYVTLVSNGDFIQGATIGVVSEGEYPVDIMNAVGYDIVTLGNHEFDYGMEQLEKLMNHLSAKVVSCNFMDLRYEEPVYSSFAIKKYGDVKVAYIGITTPESITKSTPTFFQNKKGSYIYDFCNDESGKALYKRVQHVVNYVKNKKGADYVVAMAHLGTEGTTEQWTSENVIKNTYGIDVMLDGHSHSTFASEVVKDKKGNPVVVSSTGTKFENIGKLVIAADGEIKTELVSLDEYTTKDEKTAAFIAEKEAAKDALTSKVIGTTEVDMLTKNPETGERIIRNAETNLGDFSADALRTVLDADIGIMNGGGIRADILKGDITYDTLLTVYPYGNMGCVIEVTGQQIKDALEHGAKNYPEESGGFLQVSGLQYTINSSIPSSVKTDDKGMFLGVEGKYRVSDIKVYDKETGKYKKLNLKKTYKLAGINYTLKECGDGFAMFDGCKVVVDDTIVDSEILSTYITDYLHGTVTKQYENVYGEGRITFK